MKVLFLGIAAAVAAVFLFPEPLVERVLSAAFDLPVEAQRVRWTGFGSGAADFVRIGKAGPSRFELEKVRVRGLTSFWAGKPIELRFETLRAGGEVFGPSSAWLKPRRRGLVIFTQLASDSGKARGGILLKAGHLAKLHARVTLRQAGLSRVPRPWLKRLLQTPDGPAFIALYAADRVVLRGRGGPIMEAAWQPA